MNIEQSSLPKNLMCFSHLRWDFVFQRPQHLMSRFANEINVQVLEEPVFDASESSYLTIDKRQAKLTILVPHLVAGLAPHEVVREMKNLLNEFLEKVNLSEWIFWYYTPMALQFSNHLSAALTVFDCMDELSAFDFAPKELIELEKSLLDIADVVFTGGYSLHEAKKAQHNNIHVFPSSIDKEHFSLARTTTSEPSDQADIKGIKLGFIGVIDERFDARLIKEVSEQRPDWQIVLLGPVVKVTIESLPSGPNLHYLGQKDYAELPSYLSGWDVAMIPFAINNSTRFISPTKTPEYLAAGVPVVSTPIRDVVRPYGDEGLVRIAANANEFIAAAESYITEKNSEVWLEKVDNFLKDKSWAHTFEQIKMKMIETYQANEGLLAS